jgi:hypothetical protein
MKLLFFKILIITGLTGLMCTTKVSEWVLLNALPGQYTLVYYYKSGISDKSKQANTEISDRIKTANIQFRSTLKEDIDQPYYALYFRNRQFSRYSDHNELADLTVSPLRNQIADEIMSGKLCVVLFLKTDRPDKDEKSFQLLKNTIASSPFGQIIPVIELSRNNIEEKHFVSMLLNVESDLKYINEPMLFGIFGRFKALEPLVAKGITGENINLMINFLTADCSCLIQDNLPGTDILFTNNWENPAPALVNKILDENPELMHH